MFCGQNYKKHAVLQRAVHRVTIGTKMVKMMTVTALTRTYVTQRSQYNCHIWRNTGAARTVKTTPYMDHCNGPHWPHSSINTFDTGKSSRTQFTLTSNTLTFWYVYVNIRSIISSTPMFARFSLHFATKVLCAFISCLTRSTCPYHQYS